MCCWLMIGWTFAPRVALVLMWLVNDRISQAFGGILVPLVGFFLLPWTTLVFVLTAPGGFGALDIVFLVIAVLADLSAYGGGYRYRRSSSSS